MDDLVLNDNLKPFLTDQEHNKPQPEVTKENKIDKFCHLQI